MEYRIVKTDELYHYGVKGMKWGVRKDKERVGGLTQKEYDKYYTNGRINARGKKARKKALNYQNVGKGNLGRQIVQTSTIAAVNHYLLGGKQAKEFLHAYGNLKITKMRLSGASLAKRKVVAGAFIAAMGAVTVAELSNVVATTYVSGRYKLDSRYRQKIDTRATMKGYEKQQRNKR